ncbi:hypothetical protein B0H19DRAFT_1267024 [Mycena capillaripes]|nr:hypothetical protein B0H19DRAFT_1267024 [Mycena capillaripes]
MSFNSNIILGALLVATWASSFDPLYVFTTGAVAALAQSFLAARYWLLSRNKFITLILFFFITVAAGGAFASGAAIAIFHQFVDRWKVVIPATIWLVTGAVTDISIALVLVLELRKVGSAFKETRSLVNRLVAQSIQTGTAGATVALVVLVTYLSNNQSNVPTSIAYCMGRVYCITMLANLNNRKILVLDEHTLHQVSHVPDATTNLPRTSENMMVVLPSK